MVRQCVVGSGRRVVSTISGMSDQTGCRVEEVGQALEARPDQRLLGKHEHGSAGLGRGAKLLGGRTQGSFHAGGPQHLEGNGAVGCARRQDDHTPFQLRRAGAEVMPSSTSCRNSGTPVRTPRN